MRRDDARHRMRRTMTRWLPRRRERAFRSAGATYSFGCPCQVEMTSGGHSGRRQTHYSDDKNARGLRALVDHLPDAPAFVVRDVEGAIRTHRHTGRTVCSAIWILASTGESIGEDLILR